MGEDVINLYYEIVTVVMDHMELAACAVWFCLLCRGFFRKRKQIVLIGITYFVMMAIQYYIPVYMGAMIARAVSGAVCLLLMLFLKDKTDFRDSGPTRPIKVYLVLIFFSVCDLSSNIALELYELFTEKAWRTIYMRMEETAPDAWKTYFYLYCFSTFMMYAIESLLILLLVLFINRVFYDKRGRYGWKEISILLIPSAGGFTVHMLRRAYAALFLGETEKEIIDFYASYTLVAALLILCYLTTLAIIAVELYLFQSLRRKQEEEKSQMLLQNQMQDMQSHITEVERIYTGIRGIRHDLNNHVHVIRCLLEQGQYVQATQYLATMQDTVADFDFPIKTGNPITDVIINEKYRKAQQKGITFQSDFYFVPDTRIDAFDISIILNNILENAFEAVCRSRPQDMMVSIHSARKKNAYLITVTNSFDGELCLGKDGLPESNKQDHRIHGLGLRNVRAVVEKYFGTLAIEQEGKSVVVTVMLMVR